LRRLTAAILIGLATGCLQTAQTHYERELSTADAGTAHAIHDARLQQLMRGLGRLSDDRLPKAMDVDRVREQRVEEVAAISRTMAESARTIPEVTASLDLDEGDRRALLALATRLGDQASDLARRAPDLSPTELQSALDDIAVTCRDCHARFRFPGMSH
jgi:cytochrome c556